jgi:hypothetical protein
MRITYKFGILFLMTIIYFVNTEDKRINENFKNSGLEELKNLIVKSFENKIKNRKFLSIQNNNKDLLLNITDFSVNAVLFMAQRAFSIDITARNDSSNPLPLNIDTQSLSLLVDEFNKFEKNLNMTFRIYEDVNLHQVPKFYTDPEGSFLNLQVGLEFGVYEDETSTEDKKLLNINVPARIKVQLDITDNKLSILFSSIKVDDITFYTDELSVDREKLKLSLANFMKTAVQGLKSNITNIDVLGQVNSLTGSNYSKLETVADYGWNLIHVSN